MAKFFAYARNSRGEQKFVWVEGGSRAFKITGLSPGKYWVHAYEGSLRLLSETLEVELRDQSRTGLTIALQPPFAITGKLIAPAGVDLSRSSVYLESTVGPANQGIGGRKNNSAVIGEGGKFALERVAPGSYRVAAKRCLGSCM